MNSSHTEFSFHESTLNTYENTILGIMLFMISVPGTVFLIALIQFDRIEGDPLKRRIIDQVSRLFINLINVSQNIFSIFSKIYTSFNIIGVIVDVIFVSIRLSDVILGDRLPIFAIYLETMTHEFIQCFGFFILLEIFLIKYWIEFVWKSMRQIDDSFIINFLTIFNASLAITFSCFMVVRGDEHINAKMVMNEFDWTQLFYKRKETLNLR